jgi:thiol-disulfide isomerase/thioredoxin
LLLGLPVLGGCEADCPAENPVAATPSLSPQADARSEGLRFVRGYLAGYEEAQQAGKPMLVFFKAPGCGYCEQMLQEASADAQVVRLSKRFVCVLVDADSEPEICREFRVRGYPTIQFMSPRGVPLNRLLGKTPADRLASQMLAALQATASRQRHVRSTAVR